MSATENQVAAPSTDIAAPTSFKLVAIDIPFGNLVWLWIKVTLAAIPAILILALIALPVGLFVAYLEQLFELSQRS